MIAFGGNNTSGPLEVATARPAVRIDRRCDFESETFVTAYRTTGNDGVYELGDMAGCLNTNTDPNAMVVAFAENSRAELRLEGGDGQTVSSLKTGGGKPGQSYSAIASPSSVRRLTPRECERLQGFPDDYTAIPYRGKPAADGPRYKALGNSMAVPCMAWIGRAIMATESQ